MIFDRFTLELGMENIKYGIWNFGCMRWHLRHI
jgi:hypothetical protein